MFTVQENNYTQDIKELTAYIRHDEDWEELRSILLKKEFTLDKLLLVSFMEDEEMGEFGVIVTLDKKVYEYERIVGKGIEQFKLIDITDNSNRQKEFPQISTAIKMINEGIERDI